MSYLRGVVKQLLEFIAKEIVVGFTSDGVVRSIGLVRTEEWVLESDQETVSLREKLSHASSGLIAVFRLEGDEELNRRSIIRLYVKVERSRGGEEEKKVYRIVVNDVESTSDAKPERLHPVILEEIANEEVNSTG